MKNSESKCEICHFIVSRVLVTICTPLEQAAEAAAIFSEQSALLGFMPKVLWLMLIVLAT